MKRSKVTKKTQSHKLMVKQHHVYQLMFSLPGKGAANAGTCICKNNEAEAPLISGGFSAYLDATLSLQRLL